MPKKKIKAGRPLKYGEETEAILIRIPKTKKREFKEAIKPILKRWEK